MKPGSLILLVLLIFSFVVICCLNRDLHRVKNMLERQNELSRQMVEMTQNKTLILLEGTIDERKEFSE